MTFFRRRGPHHPRVKQAPPRESATPGNRNEYHPMELRPPPFFFLLLLSSLELSSPNVYDPEDEPASRKADVRLPGKGNSNSHGARPAHLIITMIKWIRTSRLSIEKYLRVEICRESSSQWSTRHRAPPETLVFFFWSILSSHNVITKWF